MNLLKWLLPLCFMSLAVAYSLETSTAVINERKDTITIYSIGTNNKINIDSIHLKDSINVHLSSPMKGEIIQVGQNNSVDINSKAKTKDKQVVSTLHHIKVSQTGENNSVKINSH